MNDNRQTVLFTEIASRIAAIENCQRCQNTEWRERHTATVEALVSDFMPSGSGFDNGTRLDMKRSTPSRLVFLTSFHHMNEHGCYDGWTTHTVIVTPAFIGRFDIKVNGINRNEIKDYIGETFYGALSTVIEDVPTDPTEDGVIRYRRVN
jgi:hypothetical protein